MIIVGEKLNSSIKDTRLAMEKKDAAYISALAKAQYDAGADYIDINAALFLEDEPEMLKWTVQNAVQPDGRVMLDSPNPKAIETVLKDIPLQNVIINSITMEKKRFESFLPLVKQYNTGVVGLPIDDNGMPHSAEERVEIAERLIKSLQDAGVAPEKIFIDLLVETAATGDGPKKAVNTARLLREKHPDIHIICGLSNVSFGLPKRESLNAAFLSAAIFNGLDSAIMDITNESIRNMLHAARVISGDDEYCMDYITYCKNG